MLTVILFPESERDYILKYQFIYVNFQFDKQIALCEWKAGMTAENIFGELDSLTSDCHEWKLLVFAGNLPAQIEDVLYYPPLKKLLKVYTGVTDAHRQHTVSGFLPAAVWCVGYREKTLRTRIDAAAFEQADVSREFGSSFRMIWFELSSSSNMQQQFDQFRMTCGLLVLAINDIPTYFLERGYSYRMEVEIKRSDFAEYVAQLRSQLEQIKTLTLEAYQNLENDYRRQARYPEAVFQQSSLTGKRSRMDGDSKWKPLQRKDLLKDFELEAVLDDNRKWLRSRLYFPKGILKQELARVQNSVDAAKRAEYRLNDAAKDRLEQELTYILEKMQSQQKKQLRQRQIMKDINVWEKKLLRLKARWQWGIEKQGVWLILSFVQTMLLAPFVLFHLPDLAQLPVLGQLMGRLAQLPQLGLLALMPVVCYVILALLFGGIAWIEFVYTKWHYQSLLENGIEQAQEEQLQYMEDMVDLIAQYQYAIQLKRDDLNRLRTLEHRRKMLARHTRLRENGEAICRQFELLLGEDERVPLPEASFHCVDFTKGPSEIEYYWIPYRRSKSMTELNSSGHLVNAFFRFISGITLKKTPVSPKKNTEHITE